jgi:ssDNA-binding Zn-finger/Zn-ribbon topoisomerase 1
VKTIRIPTREDYEAFDGAHCDKLWRELGEGWRCPACDRTKFEVMRWTRRRRRTNSGPNAPYIHFMGWLAAFHRHHDHQGDFDRGIMLEGEWIHSPSRRFEETVICDQCNTVDGFVKRRLGLPADWSYSPEEIRRFVTATPHGNHVVDFVEARRIYDAETDIFAEPRPRS